MKIKNSAVITESDFYSGIGKYAWNLYNLGFFDDIYHLSYNCTNHVFKNHYCQSKSWGVNILTSLYLGGVYKKIVQKFDFVHLSSQSTLHLVRYNRNAVGTIHDFFNFKFIPKYSFFYHWQKKNLNYVKDLKGIVVNSDHIKQEAEEMFKDVEFTRIHLWLDNPNFKVRDRLEARKKLGLDENKIYLLSVSRDVKRKNLDLLPEIMNAVELRNFKEIVRRLDERFVLIRIGSSDSIINKF